MLKYVKFFLSVLIILAVAPSSFAADAGPAVLANRNAHSTGYNRHTHNAFCPYNADSTEYPSDGHRSFWA